MVLYLTAPSYIVLLPALFLAVEATEISVVNPPRLKRVFNASVSEFGVQYDGRWPPQNASKVPLPYVAEEMLRTGASWVREDVQWADIEKTRGKYHWEAAEAWLKVPLTSSPSQLTPSPTPSPTPSTICPPTITTLTRHPHQPLAGARPQGSAHVPIVQR